MDIGIWSQLGAILVAIFIGVAIKIGYDFLRAKKEETEPSSTCLFHSNIEKEINELGGEDARQNNCFVHIKEKVHGLEVVTAQHDERLTAGDNRMQRIEGSLDNLDKRSSAILSGVNALLNK